MLIIDLDAPYLAKKSPKKPEIVLVSPVVATVTQVKKTYKPDIAPLRTLHTAPDTDEKARLLRQLEDEDARVRIERAKLHRRYFDLLTPDLLPKPGADFSDIYEQMDDFQRQLQGIWIKRQQVEKYGTLKKSDPVTKDQLTQLSAFKHERSNAYKNLSKWQMKVAEAKAKNSPHAITAANSKIHDIELKIIELTHQINELNERVKIAR